MSVDSIQNINYCLKELDSIFQRILFLIQDLWMNVYLSKVISFWICKISEMPHVIWSFWNIIACLADVSFFLYVMFCIIWDHWNSRGQILRFNIDLSLSSEFGKIQHTYPVASDPCPLCDHQSSRSRDDDIIQETIFTGVVLVVWKACCLTVWGWRGSGLGNTPHC